MTEEGLRAVKKQEKSRKKGGGLVHATFRRGGDDTINDFKRSDGEPEPYAGGILHGTAGRPWTPRGRLSLSPTTDRWERG